MDLFAVYDPDAPRGAPLGEADGLVIRLAEIADIPALADLSHERNGGKWSKHEHGFARDIGQQRDEVAVFVAELSGRVIGYARAVLFVGPDDAPANVAPDGWYLMGVVVRPEHRRRGVATRLVESRLAWIGPRADRVFSFANADNAASLAMLNKLGFVELTRDFWFPRVTFRGGVGVLSCRQL